MGAAAPGLREDDAAREYRWRPASREEPLVAVQGGQSSVGGAEGGGGDASAALPWLGEVIGMGGLGRDACVARGGGGLLREYSAYSHTHMCVCVQTISIKYTCKFKN